MRRAIVVSGISALLTAVCASCGDDAVLSVGPGLLQPTPLILDLGRVPSGQYSFGTVALVNVSDATITVSDLVTRIDSDDAPAESLCGSPIDRKSTVCTTETFRHAQIAGGSQLAIKIGCAPLSVDYAVQGAVVVISDAPIPMIEIPVMCIGVAR
jgi:hypothetical protein